MLVQSMANLLLKMTVNLLCRNQFTVSKDYSADFWEYVLAKTQLDRAAVWILRIRNSHADFWEYLPAKTQLEHAGPVSGYGDWQHQL